MKLSHWKAKGYRSIGDGKFDADQFNILIGRNNTGKSNIIKSLIEYAAHLTYNTDQRSVHNSPIFSHDDNLRYMFSEPNWEDVITRNSEYDSVLLSFEFKFDCQERRSILEALEDEDVGEEYIKLSSDTESFSKVVHEIQYNGHRTKSRFKINLPTQGMTVVYDKIGEESISTYISNLPPESENQSTSSSGFSYILRQRLQKSLMNFRLAGAFRDPKYRMRGERANYLKPSGENLVRILDTMADNYQEQFRRVEETYVDIMEGVSGIRTPFIGEGNERTVKIDESGYSDGFSLEEISGGSREILTLITKIVKAEDEADLLFIEEPELHIHPSAQQALYDLIENVCSGSGPQVILSTHSDVFVNRTDTSNIISVRRDVETEIEPIEGDVENLLNQLGYSKSEVLQSTAAVFVEGVSDKSVLEEFSKILSAEEDEYESIDELGVTARPLGGDRLRRHGGELHNSLGHLRIPHFFLVDSDDQSPEEKEAELEGDLEGAELHVLEKYCIESYLLESPQAVSEAFNLDENDVREYIEESEARPNKKYVLDDLIEDLAGQEGGYDEREHSWIIARHFEAADIPDEIVLLIDRIQDLPE